jgi:hypothetical protein
MSETGRPLIPREVLPAPVKPARRTRIGPRLPALPGDAARQLSIFGAETTEPSPADLAGLLAGPGRLGRMGGTARVSVTVDAAWRVHVLVAELVRRGLVVNWHQEVRVDAPRVEPEPLRSSEISVTDEISVRRSGMATTFDPDADPPPDLPSDVDFLPTDPSADSTGASAGASADSEAASAMPVAPPAPIAGGTRATPATPAAPTVPGALAGPAAADTDGAEESTEDPEPPETPPKPRFEVVTAYSSRLNPLARAWPEAAAQLFLSGPRLRLWVAAAGEPVPGGYALGLGPGEHNSEELRAIDAALVRAGLAGRLSDDGQHYVIAGRRRLTRLAELVGERPAAAPPELWPNGAAA